MKKLTMILIGLLTVAAVSAQQLENFPDPFIHNGGLTGTHIIIGSDADPQDLYSVMDLAVELQAEPDMESTIIGEPEDIYPNFEGYEGNIRNILTQAQADNIVNPFKLGLAKLDNDVIASDRDLIVIGGPCANAVADELFGNPEDCTAGFEENTAIVEYYTVDGNTVLLIAGYDAEDTRAAVNAVAKHENYNLQGDGAVLSFEEDIEVVQEPLVLGYEFG